MCAYITERLLVLTKTYPIPSESYIETTCVAALSASGLMRRLYPIPFRIMERGTQFQKWEWITAGIDRASSDRRPESYRIDIDSIQRVGIVKTDNDWFERLKLIKPFIAPDFTSLDQHRENTGVSLGILRVSRLVALEIEASDEMEWSEKRKSHLNQQGLFHSEDVKNRPLLRKLPYDFYYCYEINTTEGIENSRHKITDWEVGALYWNCMHRYGKKGWEAKFRNKIEVELGNKDLHFLMGTMHRFPKQWLIIGLIYPPKPKNGRPVQASLDFGV